MASIKDKAGTSVGNGYKLISEAPLDVRFVVEDTTQLNSIVTDKGCYPGLEVWVESDSKKYRAIPSDGSYEWQEVGTKSDVVDIDTSNFVTVAGDPQTISSAKTFTSLTKILITEENEQDNALDIRSTSNGTTDGIWRGRMVVGSQDRTFLMGVYKNLCGLGAHKWTSPVAWEDIYINPDGTAKLYLGGKNWTKDSGVIKIENTSLGAFINRSGSLNSTPTWNKIASIDGVTKDNVTTYGTSGTLPKFYGDGRLGNSRITDDGSTIQLDKVKVTNPVTAGTVSNVMFALNVSAKDSALNLNNLTEAGVYRLASIADAQNCPNFASGSSLAYGQVLVVRGAGDTAAQIAFPYLASEMAFRVTNAIGNDKGTWKDWVQVASQDWVKDYISGSGTDGSGYVTLNTVQTITATKNFKNNAKIVICGTAASKNFMTRAVVGSDGNGAEGDLYLNYQANFPVHWGASGTGLLNADGSATATSFNINSKATWGYNSSTECVELSWV